MPSDLTSSFTNLSAALWQAEYQALAMAGRRSNHSAIDCGDVYAEGIAEASAAILNGVRLERLKAFQIRDKVRAVLTAAGEAPSSMEGRIQWERTVTFGVRLAVFGRQPLDPKATMTPAVGWQEQTARFDVPS